MLLISGKVVLSSQLDADAVSPCAVWTSATSPLKAPAKTAELVVAHCKHDLRWVQGSMAEVQALGLDLTRVTIYTKCNSTIDPTDVSDQKVVVISMANVGRNDQAYAHHIAKQHSTLADVVIFIKDTHFDSPLHELRNQTRNTTQLVTAAIAGGFGCGNVPYDVHSLWHRRSELLQFRLPSYMSAVQHAEFRARTGQLNAQLR